MFTGLIEDMGRVRNIVRQSAGLAVEIACDALPVEELRLGDSVACNGTCLTVVAKAAKGFTVELSTETVARSTWKDAKPGWEVNLERALAVGGRLDGHIVSGHVDGVGTIRRLQKAGAALDVTIAAGPEVLRYVVEKGSIAVDGISLTVNRVDANGFGLMLIPHTREKTTLAGKREGATVNLECDILGKYVEKLLMKDGKIDRAFLARNGFLK